MRSKTHNRSLICQPWHGRTLLILALLFLAAPNALADNPSIGCPLTTVNVAADSCFIVTPPVGSVTIDGVLTGAEWTGAIEKNITGPPVARIRFRRNGANFVFLISVNDTSNNISDSIQLSFDPLHNHGTTTDDVTFTIRREGTGHQRTDSGGTAPWVPGVNLVTCTDTCTTPDFVNGWQAEVVITPADLALPNLSAIVGFNLTVSNQDTADISNWPFPAAPNADTWANIKTRLPVELLMVLDQSGSMLSFDRWNSAKRAANLLANTLFALKEATFLDQLGMVTFKSDCTTNVDTTSLPKPLLDLPGAFPGDYVSGTPDPLSNNCTPIGKGLDKAFEGGAGTLLVNSQPTKEAERIVLLLSDGFHNSPPANVPLLPSHLLYDPCPGTNAWDPCPGNTVHRVRVNTVGLGSDASVDTALLTDIKNRFAGNIFGATYNIADVGETGLLMDHFIGTLDDLFQVNALPPGSPFTVNTLERKLIVIVTWHTPTDAGAITLTRDGNPVVCNPSNFSVAAGHSICIVNNPQSGSYIATVANAPERQFNLVDLHLAATFAIDKQLHGTGQDLVLTARLNEAGVPVTNTGAHPVNVTVNIKRPTEGFGTYVSTHEPTNCAGGPPQLPPVRQDLSTGRGPLPVIPQLLATTPGNEPKPARFAKISELFTKCSKSSLSVIEEPGTPMFDDGTHGDVTANDGIYTLRIENAQTQFEGSYSFRFRAAGKSPSGSDFGRVKTLGEYVRVNVDPGSTPIDFRVLQQSGTIITREYHITPRDRFGGYLGPGHSDQITFTTTAGTFVTPLIDYNNGIYSRVLRFDSATESPVVGGTVQGKPLNPTSGGGRKGFEFFPYIGGSVYDNSLGLDNGFTLGARFGYRFPNQFALEFESGLTFTEFNTGPNTGRSAKLVQVLGNVRYDIDQWGTANWTPYVIAGVGGVFLRGAGSNDSAFAFHSGFGSTFRLTNRVGLRVDGRVFRFGSLNGAGSTTAFQFNGGVVFRF